MISPSPALSVVLIPAAGGFALYRVVSPVLRTRVGHLAAWLLDDGTISRTLPVSEAEG